MKVTLEVNARQPHFEFVEHFAVGQSDGAKQFRLGNLEEANVRAVEDDSRRVNVTPTYSLFNRKFFMRGPIPPGTS